MANGYSQNEIKLNFTIKILINNFSIFKADNLSSLHPHKIKNFQPVIFSSKSAALNLSNIENLFFFPFYPNKRIYEFKNQPTYQASIASSIE